MKIFHFFLPLAATLFLFACQNTPSQTDEADTQEQAAVESSRLKKFWESDPYLETSESVLYNPWDNSLFVSCIYGSNPTEKDGNGLISKISIEDGQTMQERFAKGLHAPKGMGLSPDSMTLYVSDIDRLVAIHARSGNIIKEYPVEGAQFLNDVFVNAKDGTVYFSDTETGKIHRLRGEELSVLAEVKAPNGITAYDDSTLLVLSFAGENMFLINTSSGQVQTIEHGIPGGDGVVPDGNGHFFASNWNGQIYLLDQDLNPTLLLDTREQEVHAADIEYVPGRKLLLVPTFFKNSVVAYRVP